MTKRTLRWCLRNLVSLLVLAVAAVPALTMIVFFRVARYFSPDKTSQKSAVFVGIHEIASNIYSISDDLSRHGYQVFGLIEPNKFTGNLRDAANANQAHLVYMPSMGRSRITKRFYLLYRFFYYLWKCEIFYFVWNTSFLPFNCDYAVLWAAGKKLIVMHCGDDVRYRPMHEAINLQFGIQGPPYERSLLTLVRNWYFQAISELFGIVISHRNQATLQYGKLYHFGFPMQRLRDSPRKPNRPVKIVHAPSDRIIKGTSYVLQAVDLLRQSGWDFEFILIENENNRKVLEYLQTADIVIDQPGTWPARFAIEGCASSCCVVGGNRSVYCDRYDSPVLQFEPDSEKLAAVIELLLADRTLLESKMRQCYEFWERHYSYEAFAQEFKALLSGEARYFVPLRNQRELVLKGASSRLEYLLVKLFYHPKKLEA